MENSDGNQPTTPIEPPKTEVKVRSDLEKLVELAENSKALKFLIGVAKILHGEWEGLKKSWLAVVIILLVACYAVYLGTAKVKDHGNETPTEQG
jgi:hypothetical protein